MFRRKKKQQKEPPPEEETVVQEEPTPEDPPAEPESQTVDGSSGLDSMDKWTRMMIGASVGNVKQQFKPKSITMNRSLYHEFPHVNTMTPFRTSPLRRKPQSRSRTPSPTRVAQRDLITVDLQEIEDDPLFESNGNTTSGSGSVDLQATRCMTGIRMTPLHKMIRSTSPTPVGTLPRATAACLADPAVLRKSTASGASMRVGDKGASPYGTLRAASKHRAPTPAPPPPDNPAARAMPGAYHTLDIVHNFGTPKAHLDTCDRPRTVLEEVIAGHPDALLLTSDLAVLDPSQTSLLPAEGEAAPPTDTDTDADAEVSDGPPLQSAESPHLPRRARGRTPAKTPAKGARALQTPASTMSLTAPPLRADPPGSAFTPVADRITLGVVAGQPEFTHSPYTFQPRLGQKKPHTRSVASAKAVVKPFVPAIPAFKASTAARRTPSPTHGHHATHAKERSLDEEADTRQEIRDEIWHATMERIRSRISGTDAAAAVREEVRKKAIHRGAEKQRAKEDGIKNRASQVSFSCGAESSIAPPRTAPSGAAASPPRLAQTAHARTHHSPTGRLSPPRVQRRAHTPGPPGGATRERGFLPPLPPQTRSRAQTRSPPKRREREPPPRLAAQSHPTHPLRAPQRPRHLAPLAASKRASVVAAPRLRFRAERRDPHLARELNTLFAREALLERDTRRIQAGVIPPSPRLPEPEPEPEPEPVPVPVPVPAVSVHEGAGRTSRSSSARRLMSAGSSANLATEPGREREPPQMSAPLSPPRTNLPLPARPVSPFSAPRSPFSTDRSKASSAQPGGGGGSTDDTQVAEVLEHQLAELQRVSAEIKEARGGAAEAAYYQQRVPVSPETPTRTLPPPQGAKAPTDDAERSSTEAAESTATPREGAVPKADTPHEEAENLSSKAKAKAEEKAEEAGAPPPPAEPAAESSPPPPAEPESPPPPPAEPESSSPPPAEPAVESSSPPPAEPATESSPSPPAEPESPPAAESSPPPPAEPESPPARPSQSSSPSPPPAAEEPADAPHESPSPSPPGAPLPPLPSPPSPPPPTPDTPTSSKDEAPAEAPEPEPAPTHTAPLPASVEADEHGGASPRDDDPTGGEPDLGMRGPDGEHASTRAGDPDTPDTPEPSSCDGSAEGSAEVTLRETDWSTPATEFTEYSTAGNEAISPHGVVTPSGGALPTAFPSPPEEHPPLSPAPVEKAPEEPPAAETPWDTEAETEAEEVETETEEVEEEEAEPEAEAEVEVEVDATATNTAAAEATEEAVPADSADEPVTPPPNPTPEPELELSPPSHTEPEPEPDEPSAQDEHELPSPAPAPAPASVPEEQNSEAQGGPEEDAPEPSAQDEPKPLSPRDLPSSEPQEPMPEPALEPSSPRAPGEADGPTEAEEEPSLDLNAVGSEDATDDDDDDDYDCARSEVGGPVGDGPESAEEDRPGPETGAAADAEPALDLNQEAVSEAEAEVETETEVEASEPCGPTTPDPNPDPNAESNPSAEPEPAATKPSSGPKAPSEPESPALDLNRADEEPC